MKKSVPDSFPERTYFFWGDYWPGERLLASLYLAFSPDKARRLANRLEIHHTPKHGSWLNVAEIKLSVLKRQCLSVRIDCIEKMREKVAAWNNDRNCRQTTVDWQFKTDDARIKLKRLYPKL